MDQSRNFRKSYPAGFRRKGKSQILEPLNEEGKVSLPKKKSKRIRLVLFVVAILLLVGIVWSFFSTSSSIFNFALSGKSSLKSTDDRVNILLLGVGGEGHDGPYLTDSIIVASYNLKTNKATLIA